QSMYLDPSIRDWVLIPIMAAMILVGVFRHHVTVLLTGEPKKPTYKALREGKALFRSQILRTNGSNLPNGAYQSRKSYLMEAFKKGEYLKAPADPDAGPPNPMTDPAGMDMMMDGMKKQMAGMIPQMLIMTWVNFFFSGFVLVRLPFPLTIGFKSMLQRGVNTADMDVTWVSSLSWYFLNLFGLRGLFTILLGDNNCKSRDMQAMTSMGMTQQQPGQVQDFPKLFEAERENLQMTPHVWEGEGVEERLLKKHGYLN
ncbi:integral membrane protein DUF106-domain-containing protein, partial [Piptocephalis cylindrospora]